jgi:hypothetical protein
MAEPPTIAADVRLPTPVFLRKLRRRQDWGSDETPIAERAADLVKVIRRSVDEAPAGSRHDHAPYWSTWPCGPAVPISEPDLAPRELFASAKT